jgi:glycosyltransferase involved in cell wall biosynthesis
MKPKVLLFIDWFLPGNKAGGPVTSVSNIVGHLRGDLDFYIMTRDTDYCEDLPYPSIPSNQWVPYKEGVSVFYFSKDYLTLGNLKKVAMATGCGHWYINGIYSLYFSILPLFLSRNIKGLQVTVASRGMLSPHAMAVKPFRKNLMLGLFKSIGFYTKVRFHATNAIEATEIAKQVGANKGIQIAPNLSSPLSTNHPLSREKKPGVLRLLSIARISPEKNTLGALQVLAACEGVKVRFDLYGQVYDPKYKEQCDEAIQALPANIQVNFHGSISSNQIHTVLQSAHFLFLPTRGENFGHAILESMLGGCPVIISDQTPWKNLEEKGIGWDIALDDKGKFIEVIAAAAAMDQEAYSKMSKAAFAYAKEFTDNPQVLQSSRQLFGLC